jgi:hypothetical protein
MQRRDVWHWLGLAVLLGACHSPGQYGHSARYAPLDDETDAVRGAQSYDALALKGSAEGIQGKRISAFGVVRARRAGRGGASYVTLSVRRLEPRNLCKTADEDSCRVTVGEREHSVVHAHVRLESEDDIGKKSVAAGSLLRVVGVVADEVDADDGSPVIRATYYRHWPRDYYATRPPGPAEP